MIWYDLYSILCIISYDIMSYDIIDMIYCYPRIHDITAIYKTYRMKGMPEERMTTKQTCIETKQRESERERKRNANIFKY